MTPDIQSLIEKRPHLKDPLEFYAKWQQFQQQASALVTGPDQALPSLDSRGYPAEKAGGVLQLFATVFDLPAEELAPLCRAMEAGDIDFMRLPLEEVPPLPLPYGEEELASLLFLLGRPYFLALRATYPLDGRRWENGRCPCCSARPSLACLVEGPGRQLHCSYCGTSGPYRFLGCPNCETGDTAKLGSLVPDDESGFMVSTCDECQTYVKVVEKRTLDKMTADLADMASLPLDIIAQSRGYTRAAANPIGLLKMM